MKNQRGCRSHPKWSQPKVVRDHKGKFAEPTLAQTQNDIIPTQSGIFPRNRTRPRTKGSKRQELRFELRFELRIEVGVEVGVEVRVEVGVASEWNSLHEWSKSGGVH